MKKNFKKIFLVKDIRKNVIFLFLVLFFLNIRFFGFKYPFFTILQSISFCVITELLIFYFKNKRFLFPYSAIITGFIIGFVLNYMEKPNIIFLTSILSISSKHIIKFNNRHIFNPANFGLFLMNIFFKTKLLWWVSNQVLFIIFFGALISLKMKNFLIILIAFLVQIILIGIYSVYKGNPFLKSILFTNPFFLFFMLIEHKTSPKKIKGQSLYGILNGVFYSFFIIFLPEFDPGVCSLFFNNLIFGAIK